MSKIRIKDIAKRAGVSIGTVDRVIHERGEVSDETREKVMSIIEELNYQPNLVARTLAAGKKFTIAVLSPSSELSGAYWEEPMKGFLKAEEELKPYGVELKFIYFNQYDVSSFTEMSEVLIETGCDAVVMAPTFKREALELTKRLDKRGTPYLFFDSNIKETNSISFVGNDNYASGTVAARLLTFGTSNNEAFLIVHLTKELGNQQYLTYRANGFNHHFESHNLSNKILSINVAENGNISRELTLILNNNPDIRGVFVTNSKTHLIADALYSLHREDLKIVGYAVIPDNNRFLETGIIDFLISQSPYEQGYRSIISIFNHLINGEEIQKRQFTPIEVVMRENLPFV